MQLADLNADNFVENALGFGLLDDEAKAAITARHTELVAQKSANVNNVPIMRPAVFPNVPGSGRFGPPAGGCHFGIPYG